MQAQEKKSHSSVPISINVPLLIIILLGFIIRMYYANTVVVRGDSSSYIYQSYLIHSGDMPFRDYFARSPGYLFFLAGWMRLFGRSLFIMRMSSVVVSTATIPVLYQIGKKGKNETTGIIFAFLFAFTPYNWKIGSTVMTQVLEVLLFTITILLLLKYRSDGKIMNLFLMGLLVGYSVLIRQTAGLFIFIIPILLYWVHKQRDPKDLWKNIKGCWLKETVVFGLSCFVTVAAIYLLFIQWTSYHYMIEASFWGAGARFDIHGLHTMQSISSVTDFFYFSFLPIQLFIIFVIILVSKNVSIESRNILRIIMPFSFMLLYLFITPYRIPPRMVLTGELYDLVVLILFSICLVRVRDIDTLIFSRLNTNHNTNHNTRHPVIMIVSIMASFIVYSHIQYYPPLLTYFLVGCLVFIAFEIMTNESMKHVKTSNYFKKVRNVSIRPEVTRILKCSYRYRFSFFLFIIIALFLYIEQEFWNNLERTLFNIVFIFSFALAIFLLQFIRIPHAGILERISVIWFFPFFLFYIYYGYPLEYYYYEFIPAVIIGAGIIAYHLFHDVPKRYHHMSVAFITLGILSILISNSILLNTFERQSTRDQITPQTHNEIVQYLRLRDDRGDELFTSSGSIAVELDMKLVAGMVFKTYYQRPDTFPDTDITGFPTIREIMDHMLQAPVTYCVIDPLTVLYFFSPNPEFEEFIKEHYTVEKRIENVDIYRIKEESIGYVLPG